MKYFLFLLSLGSFLSSTVNAKVVPDYLVQKTKNGVSILFIPVKKVPLFEIVLLYGSGSNADPIGKSGSASMMGLMLSRGVQGLNEEQIAEKLDDVAGDVDCAVGENSIQISAAGLNAHFDSILDVLFRQVSNPTFPQSAFKRVQKSILESIKQISDSPPALANEVLYSTVFDDTSRARPLSGFYSDVLNLTPQEIRQTFRKQLNPKMLTVLFLGNVDYLELLKRRIENLPDHTDPIGVKTAAPFHLKALDGFYNRTEILAVNRPGLTEAQIRLGFRSIPRSHPDWIVLSTLNTILSETYSSRLTQELREKSGLVYSVDSSFAAALEDGIFSISTSAKNDEVFHVITKIQDELNKLVLLGITEDELLKAKEYISGSFPLSLQNEYAIGGVMFSSAFYGIDYDFWNHYLDEVQNLSVDRMNTAIRRHFKQDNYKWVIVGDLKKIKGKIPAPFKNLRQVNSKDFY